MSETYTRRVCPERLAPHLFFLCIITYIVALFGRMSYSSVMAELIATEGFTKSQAGLIGTALFATYGVCQIFSGFLGDKLDPKKMIAVGVAASGALNIGMGLAGTLPVMLGLWMANGVFQSFVWSPVARIFAEFMPPAYRKGACANSAVAFPLATIFMYLAASLLLQFADWRAVFILSGAAMLVCTAVWLNRMNYFQRMTEKHGPIETVTLNAAEAAASGSLLKVLLASGVMFAIFGSLTGGLLRDGIQSWVPTFMTERFGLSTALSVALAIALPVVNIGGVFGVKALAARRIRNEMRGAAGFFLACIVCLALLIPASGTSAVGSLLLMTAASTCMVGSNTMFMNFMPVHFGTIGKVSSITGVLNCASYVGSAISSYGIGHVAERFGWVAAIWVWLGFSAAAMVLAYGGVRRWGKYRHDL
ncbi:MFS transporter [Intestinibacillus massiliensis]|uniref:MFS transporter n=1 Tax=Intestinibacillus massiliensis TaxID=1871029 RepID=UPI000B358D0D|nr:MFS transporter [Intestinibacillus massiliensis]MCB6365723.1 MFS transporter [Intestinibacillus massiliensis]